MSAADGKVWIVFNGEIYNHLDIRKALPSSIAYRGTSDTETILHAYLAYGVDVLKRLNGIFTFAIYDLRDKTIFVARDPLGVKPLYYYCKDGRLLFGSELKAICQLPGVDQELNPRALVDYIHFLWSPGEGTPFRHFRKLEAGHYFVFELNNSSRGVSPQKYYELPYDGTSSSKTEAQLTDQLDHLLCQAVDRQLISDVPIGFFLSGGLDSSLITAIARKKIGSSVNCYTIRTNADAAVEGFADDLKYAQRVAQHLDVKLNIVEGDSDIMRDFDSMIWHLDEPQADPAPLHVRNICRIARERGDIVLLGGTAGDDLFSGYRRHQALNFEPWFRLMPAPLRAVVSTACGLLPARVPLARRLTKLTAGLAKTPLERMASYYGWTDLERNKALFAAGLRTQLKDYDPAAHLTESLSAIPKEHGLLNQMLYWDTKFFLTDHNLNYTDKMSMAEGVEVRVPFLDLDLVAFACQLPSSLKMRGNICKYLLKKVAERYLPHDVIYRPKTGFGAPVRKWAISGRFDVRVASMAAKQGDSQVGIFQRDAVRRLLTDTKSGRVDGAYTLWSVMAIASWMKQFVADAGR